MVIGAESNLLATSIEADFCKLIAAHETDESIVADRVHDDSPFPKISEHVLTVLVLLGTPKLTRFEPAHDWGDP